MKKIFLHQLFTMSIIFLFISCKKDKKVEPSVDTPEVINTSISGTTWTEILPDFVATERIMGMSVFEDKMLLSFLTSNNEASGIYEGINLNSKVTVTTNGFPFGIVSGFEKLKKINNVIFGFGSMGDVNSAYSYDSINNYWQPSTISNSNVFAMEEYNGVGIVGCLSNPCIQYRSVSGTQVSVGAGLNNSVHCLINFEGKLIAGGDFTLSGTTTVSHVAQWDGTNWLPLGDGFNNNVNDLIVFNNQLIAIGKFTNSGTLPCRYAAVWDGTNWAPLGGGLVGGYAGALVAQNYCGQLFIGGDFDSANGINSPNIIKWNGTSWEALAGGASLPIGEICIFKNKLYIANEQTTNTVNFLLRLD